MSAEQPTCQWIIFRPGAFKSAEFQTDEEDVLCGQPAVVRSQVSGLHYCREHNDRFGSGRVPMVKL